MPFTSSSSGQVPHDLVLSTICGLFMANGGLTGMRKYFDEIKEEDLRSFIFYNANSDDERDNLKLQEPHATLDMEDEDNKIEYSLEELGMSSEETANRFRRKC
ncbi:hypothetical protein CEXT_738981 [Caerostris extrusa]|uniref:Uncharacterized protein n=1 Tax=Caerostris extrusa TaxID=172846 RepID=A0AAV4WC31_CAEEX|nr:hypothetical protein CEXT_738981 [Caerostris extrusa]